MNNKQTIFTVLLFSVLLTFSSLTITPLKVSPYVTGESNRVVNNETDLRNAINDAPTERPTTIALGRDITLTGSTLTIPTDKNITLTSNKNTGYYKLTSTATEISRYVGGGDVSVSTITVNGGGVLKLDGINITHDYKWGTRVVTVNGNGHLIMYNGLISSKSNLGGVINYGIFEMYDGEISGNSALTGGGVLNWGVFRMFGGTITGNTGTEGGGVHNWDGVFEMSGGTITGNSASKGGGVYNGASFTMSGGTITDNRGTWGGGVSNMGFFIMKNGIISNNTALHMGGGVNNGGSHNNQLDWPANFEMSGGEISCNIADKGELSGDTPEKGGGVYNSPISTFSLSGTAVISNNKATNLGGGICNDGNFTMTKGTISHNSANTGGGIYIGNGEVKLSGGKVFGNTANRGNNVHNENGTLVRSKSVITNNITLEGRNSYVLIVAVVVTVCAVIVWLVYFRKNNKTLNRRKTKPKQPTEQTVHNGEQHNEH